MGKMLAAQVTLGIVLTFSTLAATENPYQTIVKRNVFGLREPPPPAPPPAVPIPEDTTELLLTGVVDFRLYRWALITCTERGKAPRSYTLGVGNREGNLQLLDIDAKAGTVRVLRGSKEVVLSLDKQDGHSRQHTRL
jgi:hypothetical protein